MLTVLTVLTLPMLEQLMLEQQVPPLASCVGTGQQIIPDTIGIRSLAELVGIDSDELLTRTSPQGRSSAPRGLSR